MKLSSAPTTIAAVPPAIVDNRIDSLRSSERHPTNLLGVAIDDGQHVPAVDVDEPLVVIATNPPATVPVSVAIPAGFDFDAISLQGDRSGQLSLENVGELEIAPAVAILVGMGDGLERPANAGAVFDIEPALSIVRDRHRWSPPVFNGQ